MEITETQYACIAPYLPVQRGNVRVSNLQVLNAWLYVMEHGCKWRDLPAHFGPWNTIYKRLNYWAKQGVLAQVAVQLQQAQILADDLEVLGRDSTIVPVPPAGTGAGKKRPPGHRPLPRGRDHPDPHRQ